MALRWITKRPLGRSVTVRLREDSCASSQRTRHEKHQKLYRRWPNHEGREHPREDASAQLVRKAWQDVSQKRHEGVGKAHDQNNHMPADTWTPKLCKNGAICKSCSENHRSIWIFAPELGCHKKRCKAVDAVSMKVPRAWGPPFLAGVAMTIPTRLVPMHASNRATDAGVKTWRKWPHG